MPFSDDFSGGLGNVTITRWRSMQPDNPPDPGHVVGASDIGGDLNSLTAQYPPNDVFRSGTKLYVGAGMQNYGDTSLRFKNRVDFTNLASAPVVIELDVLIKAGDPLQGWTHLYLTDSPMHSPSMTGENSNGPIPYGGCDIRLNYGRSYDGGFWPSPEVFVYAAGVEQSPVPGGFNFDHSVHFPTSGTTLQHLVMTWTHLTSTTANLTITSDGSAWYDFDISWPASCRVPMWVHIGAHNHASRKYSPYNDSYNAVFGGISYANSMAALSTYKAPDGTTSHSPASEATGVDIGWTPPTSTLTITGVPSGVTQAKLLVSYHVDPVSNAGPFTLTHSLNGNTTRSFTLVHNTSSSGNPGYGDSGSGSAVAPITVADLVSGSNTITVNITGNSSGYAAQVANVAILVEAAATVLAPPVIASSNTLYAPTVTRGAVTLSAPVIASANTLYLPTVTRGAVTVAAPVIATTTTLNAPAVVPGVVAVAPPAIGSTTVLYPPVVSSGGTNVAPPAISSSNTLYAPTVVPGTTTVTAPLIPAATVLYAPAATPGATTISPPAIASTTASYPPSISTGGTTITLPAVVPAGVVYAPAVNVGPVIVAPPGITSSTVLYPPTIVEAGSIGPPTIASANVVHPPTVAVGPVSVIAPAIPSAVVLYAPTIRAVIVITAPAIPSGTVLHPPAITSGRAEAGLPFIASATILYALIITGGITRPTPGTTVVEWTTATTEIEWTPATVLDWSS